MTKNSETTVKRNIIIHILCWGIVLFFPLLFFYNPNDTWNMTMARFMRSLGGPLCYMMLFYLNYVWLVPRLYFSDRKPLFYLINVVAIVIALVLMIQWWHLMDGMFPVERHRPRGPRQQNMMYFYNAISLVLVVGLSLAVRMSQRWQHIERARKEAEQSRTEAELSNLRNQLNPHFLLNTLNNIYALIAFDADKAQLAVDELSRLLRHVLYDNQQDFVPLSKEVDFMRNYIELMKIRVTSGVKITTNIKVEPDDSTPIAPLIFISLLENAFKHGISPRGEGFINVDISRDGDDIICQIINSNHPKRDNDKSGSGIGLEQVSKRLELTYPGRYQWEKGISEDNKQYFSKIIIHTAS